MSIFVPQRRREDYVRFYDASDIEMAEQEFSVGEARGMFILRITDGNSATNPDMWEIHADGGYKYRGEDAKYSLDARASVNVSGVIDTTMGNAEKGFNFSVIDNFSRSWSIKFDPGPQKASTIRKSSGPSLTGPVEVRTIVFK